MARSHRSRFLSLLLFIALAIPLHVNSASGENRVALVVGNGSYRDAPLLNPTNDSRAISARLRSLGFDVVERENLTQRQVGSLLREFRSRLRPGGVALFFYAGHGLQLRGENYLPVVDAEITSEEDVPMQSLSVNQVLALMDESKTRLNLVFLDACRNNPYARFFRSSASGLARLTPPSGTLISFATRPGSVASDGKGQFGLYTEHLLRAMDATDEPIELLLKRIVAGVRRASKGIQEPWMEGSIEGDFCFGTCAERLSATPGRVDMIPPVSTNASSLQTSNSPITGQGPTSQIALPINAPTTGPRYANLVLSDAKEGSAKTTFKPDTPKVFLRSKLISMPAGTKVKGNWIAVKTQAAPPNYKIDSYEMAVGKGVDNLTFSLSKPNAGWPEGDYRVDLFIDGKPAGEVKFKVAK